MFDERFQADAHHRLATAITTGAVKVAELYGHLRGSPDDLRRAGLSVAVHNDYQLAGERRTFWLMTWPTGEGHPSNPAVRAFKGEGKTDEEALDQIRASFAEATDTLHHAPLCPANHYHGKRAPTGPCSCGAARDAKVPRG